MVQNLGVHILGEEDTHSEAHDLDSGVFGYFDVHYHDLDLEFGSKKFDFGGPGHDSTDLDLGSVHVYFVLYFDDPDLGYLDSVPEYLDLDDFALDLDFVLDVVPDDFDSGGFDLHSLVLDLLDLDLGHPQSLFDNRTRLN